MSKRILVVEDDEDSERILRDLLASADYQMLEAEDGKQGIAVAEAQRPDLVLSHPATARRRIRGDPTHQGQSQASVDSDYRFHVPG
jgi:two-component system, cell cycle response regulator DivK